MKKAALLTEVPHRECPHERQDEELLRQRLFKEKTSATMRGSLPLLNSGDPAVAISVLVEYGGHGSSQAAPVAKAISESLFVVKPEIKEAMVRGQSR